MTNLPRVPLLAISSETKYLISILLNPPKFVTASNGLLRDWRGLAQVCSVSGEILPNIDADPDPSGFILNVTQKKSKDFTLQNLKEALEKIERWDIVNDSLPCLEKDAEFYLKRLEKSKDAAQQNDSAIDAEILTLDDLFRIEQGQDRQHYDAFLLYAEKDTDFANEVVENLEKKNNLKLCLKERDFIAGITFEHEAVMRLIMERCNRLILIISQSFFESPANKFFMNFAQADGIDKNQERKIIPCIYEMCELPPQLLYFSKIYYNKLSPEHFWKKLICSTKVAFNQNISKAEISLKTNEKAELSDIKTNSYVQNGFIKNIHEKEAQAEIKYTEPKSSCQSFSLTKKETSKLKKKPKEKEETKVLESIPNLPSLDRLDSLAPLTSVENERKKKKTTKFMKSYMKKKFQSLLEKS